MRALRDDRLGSDARLGLRLELAARPAPVGERLGEWLCLIDVTPLSFGLESAHGLFLPVIARNSVIPTRKTVRLRWEAGALVPATAAATAADLPPLAEASSRPSSGPSLGPSATARNAVVARVVMGERVLAADNAPLGAVEVVFPAGASSVVVAFEIDEGGVLHVRDERRGSESEPRSFPSDGFDVEWLEEHLARAAAAADADLAQRRALLGTSGVSEAEFLGACAMYQRDAADLG